MLSESLEACQLRVCAACGLTVEGQPEGPHVVLGDDTWITEPLLTAFLEACPETGGQLVIDGEFLTFSAPLQGLPGQSARMPLALVPKAGVDLNELPEVRVDLQVKPQTVEFEHPVLNDVSDGPIPVTDRMIHTIRHWSHLLRVNQLALVAYGHGEWKAFDRASNIQKLWKFLGLLLKARSLNKWRLFGAMGERGTGCNIHPTATVEACILGDGVEIGPHAVVRASWLGDGVRVHEHARVNLTVAGPGATLGRGVMSNICLLLPGALISQGFGYQGCVFGRDSFVAVGATFYDLSMGGEIKVLHEGERVSAGTHFLGVCVGHRARIGPHVRVGYGEMIPNRAFLVGDAGPIFRRIPTDLPPDVPHFCRDGEITKVERG